MKIVGLTGGIGSGKSTVAKVFEHCGVPVFYADQAGREVLNDPATFPRLIDMFGDQVVTGDQVDRAFIASKVFQDAELLSSLNQVIHPEVQKRFDAWLQEQSGHAFVLKEAAILFESGGHVLCDEVICVTAPEEMRIERVVQRDGVTKAEVESRLRNQWPENKKAEASDHVVVNNGHMAVIPQVISLTKLLSVS